MPQKHNAGLALITVLWVVLLLSLIAAGILATTRSGIRVAVNMTERAEARAAAEAAVNRAILGLLSETPNRSWQAGEAQQFAFAGYKASIRIEDEAGRIDLNTAADELLTGLFRAAGLSAEESRALTDTVVDWRDLDDVRRLNGAEAREYRAAGLDYGPRNGRFETVSELRQVLGMTDELFACVEPALTVHSHRRLIDASVAQPMAARALNAMLGSQQAVKGDGTTPRGGVVGIRETGIGRAYRIMVTVPIAEKSAYGFAAVVRLTGNSADPFWVLSWKDGVRESGIAEAACGSSRALPDGG